MNYKNDYNSTLYNEQGVPKHTQFLGQAWGNIVKNGFLNEI
jgi:hypothetical protein